MTIEELLKLPERLVTLEEKLDTILHKLDSTDTPSIDILPISKVAELTGISESTIKAAIKEGAIDKYKPVTAPIKGSTFISLSDFIENYYIKV